MIIVHWTKVLRKILTLSQIQIPFYTSSSFQKTVTDDIVQPILDYSDTSCLHRNIRSKSCARVGKARNHAHCRELYNNAYTNVIVWVDLTGPGFNKRVYGFWDGGETFRVRIVATEPGTWTWKSGSAPDDPGLADQSGSFEAVAWSEAEKTVNSLRRGFLRSTANHHALDTPTALPFSP